MKTLDQLLAETRDHVMTPEEREEQRRSFAFGNVSIDVPGVTRADVDRAAETLAMEAEHAAHEAAGRCGDCAMGIFPHYGGAPGRDFAGPTDESMLIVDLNGGAHEILAGSFVFAQNKPAPRETWPANFVEDPESPGLGTWHCERCWKGGEDG